jgi:acetyltransferase-like isoleucine patch superfamily enzyme
VIAPEVDGPDAGLKTAAAGGTLQADAVAPAKASAAAQAAPVTAEASGPSPRRPLLDRVQRALVEEVANLNFRLLLAQLFVSVLPTLSFSRLRTAIYRLAGFEIGAHSLVLGRMGFTGEGPVQKRLHIGAHTIINSEFFIDLNAEISIGDWVSVGHHVTIITANHDVGPALCRAGAKKPAPVAIGNGSWIGARSTLLPGVHIGRSSIVAAGSLVSGDVPAHRMVGGVPARSLKTLPSEP